jgi:uncharacterized protein YceH (UPF0502 family)
MCVCYLAAILLKGAPILLELSANEARIIGCLMEKSVTTPDQYPLTLNALTNACNQKSGRDPVMALDKGVVQHATRDLGSRHLLRADENFKSGVEKYLQRLCNTTYSDYQFDPAQFAIICLLLLRGTQTPGELRSRSGRLHSFEDNGEVVLSLNSLVEREGQPLVVKLPRTPGRKDSQYMHLFSGPIDFSEHENQVQAAKQTTERSTVAELTERVTKLEAIVAELKTKLDA